MHHWIPSSVSVALRILQGLLTPVIGAIAVYIAYQQWQTNKQKLFLDHYERRLRIYQRVVEMLRLACAEFKPEIRELIKFSADTAEAHFLFGEEIPKYIEEIYKHGVNLNTAKFEYRDILQPVPAGYDHQKVVNEIASEEKWFTDQIITSTAREKFRKYLDIGR